MWQPACNNRKQVVLTCSRGDGNFPDFAGKGDWGFAEEGLGFEPLSLLWSVVLNVSNPCFHTLVFCLHQLVG
jgi:hypothetical protein